MTTNDLLDDESLMTNPAKHMLVYEPEKTLESFQGEAQPASWQEMRTAYIIDFMASEN